MDAQVKKLSAVVGSIEVAEKLVEAGLSCPGQIRRATNKELEDVLGKTATTALRKRLPKRS